MFDKIITITINPALDVTINMGKIDFDEPIFASSEMVHSGGKAINVSRVLTSLGHNNTAIGIIGRENAGKFCDLLIHDKVNFDFFECDGATRENLTLVFEDERIIKINRQGFKVNSDVINKVCEKLDQQIAGYDNVLLVFAGSLPQDFTKNDYMNLIKRYSKSNIKIALDTNLYYDDEIKQIKPFIIKPNLVEFEKMTGTNITSLDDLKFQASKLVDYCEHIIVSLGSDGLFYASKAKMIIASSEQVNVVSTVGAGDTTLSGFIASLMKNQSIESAVAFATAAGTASVMLEGTGIVKTDEVLNMLNKVKVEYVCSI